MLMCRAKYKEQLSCQYILSNGKVFFVNIKQFDILLARDFLASIGSVQGPVL